MTEQGNSCLLAFVEFVEVLFEGCGGVLAVRTETGEVVEDFGLGCCGEGFFGVCFGVFCDPGAETDVRRGRKEGGSRWRIRRE